MTIMANTGTWPIDPATATGLFRFEVGDVVGTAHDPDDGQADFEFLSDDTIDALLAAYEDRDAAKSKALNSMATQLIAAAQDIVVDDIKIKTVERANLMRQLADTLAASVAEESASTFGVVSLVSAASYYPRIPQGTPRPSGLSGF